jgi:hypothetical protein
LRRDGQPVRIHRRALGILCALADAKRLTENELSDFSYLWHDGCAEAITEAQDVDRNHSAEI